MMDLRTVLSLALVMMVRSTDQIWMFLILFDFASLLSSVSSIDTDDSDEWINDTDNNNIKKK